MHLPRTDAQRSWDAMMRIATDAVSTPPGAQAPEPVVNLVCGLDTVETLLADAGLIPDRDHTDTPHRPRRVLIGVRRRPGSPSHPPTSSKP